MKTGKRTTELYEEAMNSEAPRIKSLPAWQSRRKNKSTLPRPKSTGCLKDFNILAAEDDIEDDANRAYDDYVLSRDVHGKDLNRTTNVTVSDGLKHSKLNLKKDLGSTNDRVQNIGRQRQWSGLSDDNDLMTNGAAGGHGNSGTARDNPDREEFILTRNVSGRAAYWQKREDESNKEPEFCTSSSIRRNWKTPSQIKQLKDQVDPTELTQYIYDKGVANRAAMWQKLEDDHFEKMIINPDKEWKGPAIRVVLDKNHPEYGRPPKGSKTEKRGIKAHKHIVKEIKELCQIIAENGDKQPDGTVTINFRKLFHTYVAISDKVVGILIRARKRGLLHFNGEMLYQRQDEEEIIHLFSVPESLE